MSLAIAPWVENRGAGRIEFAEAQVTVRCGLCERWSHTARASIASARFGVHSCECRRRIGQRTAECAGGELL